MGAWLKDGSISWKESDVIVEYVCRTHLGLGGESGINVEYVGHSLA